MQVNSNDEDVSVAGVIHGRWDGDYKDGTAPAAWTGSVAILEEYLTTGKEVKYGQCWVFAGVVTTVCRALGIPSRVVSNLVSAHDANSSLTVDRYYDLNNEELDYDPTNWEGEDSIWNYHVWNDVWMARPDLPLGYGGWQAIDATPQETSLGFFQCGPASLEAIKCGAVGFSYDVPFLLASVNADLFRWKEDPESDRGYTKISSNKYHIGRVIFTKAPWLFDPNGDKDREDITNQYKAEEGSATERLALMNAVRGVERAKRFYELPSISREELEFELVDLDKVNIGESFNVVVNINNKSNSVKTVKAILSAASVYYTGIKAHLIKKASGDFQVQPKSSSYFNYYGLQVTGDLSKVINSITVVLQVTGDLSKLVTSITVVLQVTGELSKVVTSIKVVLQLTIDLPKLVTSITVVLPVTGDLSKVVTSIAVILQVTGDLSKVGTSITVVLQVTGDLSKVITLVTVVLKGTGDLSKVVSSTSLVLQVTGDLSKLVTSITVVLQVTGDLSKVGTSITVVLQVTGDLSKLVTSTSLVLQVTGDLSKLVTSITVVLQVTGDLSKVEELLKLTVKPEDYLDKLVEYCNMKIYALATVTDTNETWGEEDDFQIIKPKLDIKVSESLPVNQPTVVKFSFTNPLKITLTKCQFKYEGPGVTKNKTIPYRDIRAGELVVLEHRFTPMRAGAQKLIATFSSTELLDITGAASIDVYDDTEE
uniref:Transglutaminase-like domain-containing protein n=1 Tax=Timema douglasi TaxID=61478 RepID=A0A7R8VBF6_TIMDO|nr:unnamed protein product [Timema douglasi]